METQATGIRGRGIRKVRDTPSPTECATVTTTNSTSLLPLAPSLHAPQTVPWHLSQYLSELGTECDRILCEFYCGATYRGP